MLLNDTGVSEYFESDHLKNKPYFIVNLYNQLKDLILGNFENIDVSTTKNYISFKLNERFNNTSKRKNLITVFVQRNQLKIMFGMKNGTLIDLENKTKIIHNKLGNVYQFNLNSSKDLDYFLNLFKQCYENQFKGDD